MNKTNKITYGATLGAISIVLIVLAHYLSSPDSILYFIASIPIAIYAIKFNFIDSLIMGFSLFIVMFITTNFISSILIGIPIITIGVTLGTFKRKELNIYLGIIISITVSLLFDCLVTYTFSNLFGVDFVNEIKEIYNVIFTSFGLSVELAYKWALISIPLVLFIFSVTKVIFINVLFSFISKKLNILKKDV